MINRYTILFAVNLSFCFSNRGLANRQPGVIHCKKMGNDGMILQVPLSVAEADKEGELKEEPFFAERLQYHKNAVKIFSEYTQDRVEGEKAIWLANMRLLLSGSLKMDASEQDTLVDQLHYLLDFSDFHTIIFATNSRAQAEDILRRKIASGKEAACLFRKSSIPDEEGKIHYVLSRADKNGEEIRFSHVLIETAPNQEGVCKPTGAAPSYVPSIFGLRGEGKHQAVFAYYMQALILPVITDSVAHKN